MPKRQRAEEEGDSTDELDDEDARGEHTWTEKRRKGDGGKAGAWSSAEDAALRRAFDAFAERMEWSEDQRLGPILEGATAAGAPGFWKALAAPFPDRTLRGVQRRAMKVFHPGNNKGAWSREEEARLLALVAQHGKAWRVISRALDRFPQGCKTVHERLTREAAEGGDVVLGAWGASEEAALLAGVRKYGVREEEEEEEEEGGDLRVTDIPWAAVAAHVGTRSAAQCSSKWGHMHEGQRVTYLTAGEKQASKARKAARQGGGGAAPGPAAPVALGKGFWVRERDRDLVRRILALVDEEEIDSEAGVPWPAVAEGVNGGGGERTSGSLCRARWTVLRSGSKKTDFESALQDVLQRLS
jgi:hypothetical protein